MAGTLRVFLNASALPRRPAGAGVYTLELARALAARDDVDLLVARPEGHFIANARYLESPARGPLARSLWEQRRMPAFVAADASHVYHGPHFAVPLRCPAPRVATVHDLTFFRLPRRYPFRHRQYYRALARLACRAERIIVPSGAVASDVLRYLRYSPEQIRVVPEAPRAGLTAASPGAVASLCASLGVEPGYALCVGTAEPGKRAVDAVRAIAALRDAGRAMQLVLAGNPGPLSKALRAEAARLRVADRCHFVGYVRDDDLAALYSGALALVFPSLHEGFGLPPLEAMACGTPVIATAVPAMDDVLAGAATFVPTRDPAALARALAHLADDPTEREGRVAAGLAHAARVTWRDVAALTTEVYREVAS